jgi:hypothetical protein
MTKQEIQREMAAGNAIRRQVVDCQHAHEQALVADATGTARVIAPIGHVDEVEVRVDAGGGLKVLVKVFEAVFGNKAKRFVDKPTGDSWLREQRAAWQSEHESSENKARFIMAINHEYDRVLKIKQEAEGVLDASAISLLDEALGSLSRACY